MRNTILEINGVDPITIKIGDYEIDINRQEDNGVVNIYAWRKVPGQVAAVAYHELKLDPIEDLKYKPHKNAVWLDNKITLNTLPEEIKGNALIRVIVWKTDQDGCRMVEDIVEGSPSSIVKFFNSHRNAWIKIGCDKEARLEVVRDV